LNLVDFLADSVRHTVKTRFEHIQNVCAERFLSAFLSAFSKTCPFTR
jgi:hypothetical protein